ncbi:peptidoglycan DD-metalloendopeptidase family protein [Bacillus luteolus]|uniref:Peptidoglycan DD-metalloendopeptidase family protein n=1 Tax=Litchfieldia luteola TaxID=682179 RepID=A0ABR9QPB1_9BACI|nr:peptidoglycan DD-metalloendopeptidase family protein [Cytobacillus luteolus]MBE4910328.1 peptidoglycan DD-metalloendopeptidase family protein [Cytobacillus luteolus]MBP1942097.1 LysM repeat protein [Cytobacillus luteolus]
MQDLIRRLAVVVIMGICIGLLFIGGRTISAHTISYEDKAENWVWPVAGEITDYYGTRAGKHKGIDIAAPTGADTYSVDEGIVKKSYYSYTYGHVVFIAHPSGFETVYAHLSKRSVKEGDYVKRGGKIGEIGSTGRSTGAHLHFEVHFGEWNYNKNNSIDPLMVLNVDEMLVSNDTALSNDETISEEDITNASAYSFGPVYEGELFDSWNSIEYEAGQLLSSSMVVASLPERKPNISNGKKIIVEPNETLWDISQEYLVSIESIMKWNNLNSDLLMIGQELIIHATMDEVYVVKSGDTLPEIAIKTGTTVEKIKEMNNLNRNIVHPNQILIINSK